AAQLVDRVRLVEHVEGLLLDHRLVLIVAPAGFGKSVLLAQLAHGDSSSVLWSGCNRSLPAEQLLAMRGPTTLLVDDYEPRLKQALLDLLADARFAHVRVVLASRELPILPYSRLVAAH